MQLAFFRHIKNSQVFIKAVLVKGPVKYAVDSQKNGNSDRRKLTLFRNKEQLR